MQCRRPWFDSWVRKIHWRKDRLPTPVFLGFLVAQLVKNPPAMPVTWVPSLGWEDPLEKGKATHSSIVAQRIPWTVQTMGSQRVRHDLVTFTFRAIWQEKPISNCVETGDIQMSCLMNITGSGIEFFLPVSCQSVLCFMLHGIMK